MGIYKECRQTGTTPQTADIFPLAADRDIVIRFGGDVSRFPNRQTWSHANRVRESDDVNPPPCPASTIFAGWRQSVLPVHLLGLDALLGSVGPVAGDVKLQDDGVVHDPVNRRGGGHGVGEDALPLREDQV